MPGNGCLRAVSLSVSDPQKLASFYCDILGMRQSVVGGEIAVGYGGQGASLVLKQAACGPAYRHNPDDRYWKIAITLPDMDVAHEQLVAKGIGVTEPRQFQEIARMCHLADPEGYIIELLQHSFEGKPLTTKGDPSLPLGGGAQIGLITLRTDNIDRDMKHCRDDLGMAYLSRQAVTDRGFDLYFFAFTDEQPPNPDVNAVENREWLWQRPYTSLEFQHRLDGAPIRRADEGAEGAATVLIVTSDGSPIEFS